MKRINRRVMECGGTGKNLVGFGCTCFRHWSECIENCGMYGRGEICCRAAVIAEFGIDRFTALRLCNFEARLGEIGRLQTSRLHENIFTHGTPASKLKTVRTS